MHFANKSRQKYAFFRKIRKLKPWADGMKLVLEGEKFLYLRHYDFCI